MVPSSVSIITSTSSFPHSSNFSNSFDSPSFVSTFPSIRLPNLFNLSRRNPSSLSLHYHRLRNHKSAFFNQSTPDGSAVDQFLENNSIADFMRFKNGSGNAELQTAVVSYRKRFPWSLLQPFLQVIFFLIPISVHQFVYLSSVICWHVFIDSFSNKTAQVDLVSTIHIADKE